MDARISLGSKQRSWAGCCQRGLDGAPCPPALSGDEPSHPQTRATYPVPFGSRRAGSVLGRGEQRGSFRDAEMRSCSALPPASPWAHTHRHPVLARLSGCSPGSRLARQPDGIKRPLGDGGTHLTRLTLPKGTVRHSPGLGGPRGGPRDAPSSPELRGWALQWNCARGLLCPWPWHEEMWHSPPPITLLLHPPCLLLAPGHRAFPVGGRQGIGRLQGVLRSRIALAVPPSTPQHPPEAMAWDSRSPEGAADSPKPLSAPGLGSQHRSGQAAPTPSQETRP